MGGENEEQTPSTDFTSVGILCPMQPPPVRTRGQQALRRPLLLRPGLKHVRGAVSRRLGRALALLLSCLIAGCPEPVRDDPATGDAGASGPQEKREPEKPAPPEIPLTRAEVGAARMWIPDGWEVQAYDGESMLHRPRVKGIRSPLFNIDIVFV